MASGQVAQVPAARFDCPAMILLLVAPAHPATGVECGPLAAIYAFNQPVGIGS
jgi:hypothetical protein